MNEYEVFQYPFGLQVLRFKAQIHPLIPLLPAPAGSQLKF